MKKKVCRKATEMISISMDRPLTFGEKIQLYSHLPICRACQCYRKQIILIRNIIKTMPLKVRSINQLVPEPDYSLTTEARTRIAGVLAQHL